MQFLLGRDVRNSPNLRRARHCGRLGAVKLSSLPGLALLASVYLLQGAESSAQSVALPLAIPPPPPPNLSLPVPPDLGPVVSFSFEGGGSLKTKARGKHGRFELLEIQPHEKVEIDLQYPAALLSARVTAQSLDGGKLSLKTKDSFVPSSGLVSVRFQAGDQPGLYRLLVRAGETESTLKFWVLDEKDPKTNPPALRPLLEETR